MIGKGGVEINPALQKKKNIYESTMNMIQSKNPNTYEALGQKGQTPSIRDRTVFINTRNNVKYNLKNHVYGRDDQTPVYDLV